MDLAGVVVKIIPNGESAPIGKLADAELHFTNGPLAGMRLVGFAVWGKQQKATNVTFPDRAYTTGRGDKRKYVLLRPQKNAANGNVEHTITTLILNEYENQRKPV